MFALANPGGHGLRVTFGFVSGIQRTFRGPRGRRIPEPIPGSEEVVAADAVIIDSTDLSLDEVVARVEAIITERLAARY